MSMFSQLLDVEIETSYQVIMFYYGILPDPRELTATIASHIHH
jgi:hypothetical protein